MAHKRIKLGIFFTHDENWIGGSYYILNLLSSLSLLPDEQQPAVTVVCWTPQDFQHAVKTGYRYLQPLYPHQQLPFHQRIINKLLKPVSRKPVFNKASVPSSAFRAVFPCDHSGRFDKIKTKIYWIPDMQEIHLPGFFSKEELEKRDRYRKSIASSSSVVVFSSHPAISDFKRILPSHICKTFEINFAVTHPPYNQLPIQSLKEKFSISRPWFFVPNQFWKHKDHPTVFRAIKNLNNHSVEFVFTGKENDSRSPGYFSELKQMINDWGISDRVKFLGFIDRAEQLQLMNHAIAVIQPSLFEGWSTVVEDSKAMNQWVLASDMDVHRQQLPGHPFFFPCGNDEQLTLLLRKFITGIPPRPEYQYEEKRKEFGRSFMKMLNDELS